MYKIRPDCSPTYNPDLTYTYNYSGNTVQLCIQNRIN